mgnify:CR=1 FL=1
MRYSGGEHPGVSASFDGAGIETDGVCRWTKLDGGEDRFLLGDIYGKLIVLNVVRGSGGNVVGLVATDLGDVSFLFSSLRPR